jgi:hypothetical protein
MPRIVPVAIPDQRPRSENIGTCGGVVFLSMCGGGEFDLPEIELRAYGLIELFGSVEDFRTALAAEMIEVVKLEAGDAEFSAFREKAGGAVRLSEQNAAVLKAVLTYDAAYDWEAEPPLAAREGYRLKFRTRGKVVVLDIFPASRGATALGAGGVARWARFEFGHATVAAIITGHFPGGVGGEN